MPAKKKGKGKGKRKTGPTSVKSLPESSRGCLQICSAVQALLEQRGTTLWHPLGSGKTRIAIWTGHMLLQLQKVQRVVVLVNRTALVENFKQELTQFYAQEEDVLERQLREIYGHLDLDPPREPQFTGGESPDDPRCFELSPTAITTEPHELMAAHQGQGSAKWFVCTLQKMYSAFQHQRPPPFHVPEIPEQRVRLPSSRKYKEQFAEQIFGNSFVILDEAHQLRTWRSWKPRACDAPSPALQGGGGRHHPVARVQITTTTRFLLCHYDAKGGTVDCVLLPHLPQAQLTVMQGGYTYSLSKGAPSATWGKADGTQWQAACKPTLVFVRDLDTLPENTILVTSETRTLRFLLDATFQDAASDLMVVVLGEVDTGENNLCLAQDDGLKPLVASANALGMRRVGDALHATSLTAALSTRPTELAQHARSFMFWALHATKVMLLTGTLIHNHPDDLTALLRATHGRRAEWTMREHGTCHAALDPHVPSDLVPSSAASYHRQQGGSILTNPRIVALLRTILTSPRRGDAQAYTMTLHLLEPATPEHLEVLERASERTHAHKQRLAQTRAGPTKSSYFQALHRLIRFTNDWRASSPKLEWIVADLLARRAQIKAGYRAVVFCNFIQEANGGVARVQRILASKEGRDALRVLVVHGQEEDSGQLAHIKSLGEAENSQQGCVVLCTSQTLGEGVSLHNFHDVYIADLPWSVAALEQLIGRALRRSGEMRRAPLRVSVPMLVHPHWLETRYARVRMHLGDHALPAWDPRQRKFRKDDVAARLARFQQLQDATPPDIQTFGMYPARVVAPPPSSHRAGVSPSKDQLDTGDTFILERMAKKDFRNRQFLQRIYMQCTQIPTREDPQHRGSCACSNASADTGRAARQMQALDLPGDVAYITSVHDSNIAHLCAAFQNADVLGLDCEWAQGAKRAALLQISSGDPETATTAVFNLHQMNWVPPCLRAVLEDKGLAKVGVRVQGDARMLEGWDVRVEGTRDLAQLLPPDHPAGPGDTSLAGLVQHFFKVYLLKDHQQSDWTAPALSSEQIRYAALDAYAGLLLHTRMTQPDAIDVDKLPRKTITEPSDEPEERSATVSEETVQTWLQKYGKKYGGHFQLENRARNSEEAIRELARASQPLLLRPPAQSARPISAEEYVARVSRQHAPVRALGLAPRSPEWFDARTGRITASTIADCAGDAPGSGSLLDAMLGLQLRGARARTLVERGTGHGSSFFDPVVEEDMALLEFQKRLLQSSRTKGQGDERPPRIVSVGGLSSVLAVHDDDEQDEKEEEDAQDPLTQHDGGGEGAEDELPLQDIQGKHLEQMQMQLGMLRACMGGSDDARSAAARQALSTKLGVQVTPDHIEHSCAMYVQWWRGELRVSGPIRFSSRTWRALRARARHFYHERFVPLALDLLAVNEEARARFEQLAPPGVHGATTTELAGADAARDRVPAFASPDGVVFLHGRLTLLEFKTIRIKSTH